MYCFISSCRFFNTFKNLINQFIDKINTVKVNNINKYLIESEYKVNFYYI
jgi:hypothetical protein